LGSLNGLRAFEAAARHLSFAAAAGELNVTQAAVSQQVRHLEQRLGVALFRRHANRLELTEEGRAFQPGLTEAFAAIARLTEQVATRRNRPVLVAGVAPAFALRWLIPRLTRFNRSHPEIEVRVANGGATLPLDDDWTCTVRRGAGIWPDYIAEELFPTTLVPVCLPAIAIGLRQPRDLTNATLIVVSHLRAQWAWWFRAIGLRTPIRPAGEVVFGSSAMAMQAVRDGVGVAIAQLPYVSDALASGELVNPFPITTRKFESWYLAYRAARRSEPALLAFRDWLHGEARLQRQSWKFELS
jgi:LysR family glycine cleavage system transcriptional activator/LysR family transcriptional regulator of beta-lactamase